MKILIKQDKTTEYSFGTNRILDMASDKHEVCVSVTRYNSGHTNVAVIVNNAAHRAFRRGGRNFNSVAEAVAAYKTPAIKAMIECAA